MKALRWILWPFSFLYGLGMEIRNALFKAGLLKSADFAVPVISVGNLSVGGSGKTPMVKFLITNLSQKYTIGVLSRGYGRGTSGFYRVEAGGEAARFGDEPLEIKSAFPNVEVCVCEDRVVGIAEMMILNPEINLVILDDAFQHRYVSPQVSVVLSPYNKPYFKDFVMPMGKLREFRHNIRRADAVIFTKAPQAIPEKYNVFSPEFYSSIGYSAIRPVYGKPRGDFQKCLAVSGLADDGPFVDELRKRCKEVGVLRYRDHKVYGEKTLREIANAALAYNNTLVTTAKDWVKLEPLMNKFTPELHVGVLEMDVLFDDDSFLNWLTNKIKVDEG